MPHIPNDVEKAASNTKAAIASERRHLVAAMLFWLRANPHTLLAIAAAAVILAITVGAIRG